VVNATIHGEEAMLNVLLESKPPRTRRVGGTVTSTLLHAGVIAGAIALTMPKPGRATDGPKEVSPPIFIAIRPTPDAPPPVLQHRRHDANQSVASPAPGPVLKFNEHTLPVVSQIDPSSVITTAPDTFGNGIETTGPIGSAPGLGGPGGVVEERFVERSPRLLGTPVQPTFPTSLRQSGRAGKVLVQFVVDTTGRAEMDGFKVMETSDPLFAESVRNVLPRYRFSPGEGGGRRVRTLVQLPFDFTLLR
jgi:periplasmic protein TonB